MTKTRVAIVGASGYSGEELVRLLLGHPHVELTAVTSRQNAGQTLAQVFPKFASRPLAKSCAMSAKVSCSWTASATEGPWGTTGFLTGAAGASAVSPFSLFAA